MAVLMGYATHRHYCNAWCRPPVHTGLSFSRGPGDLTVQIQTDYANSGYEVLRVTRATEVPPDDPRLILRPYAWLVVFEDRRTNQTHLHEDDAGAALGTHSPPVSAGVKLPR